MTVIWKTIDSFQSNFSRPELVTERPCPICNGIDHCTLLIFKDFQYFTDSASDPKRMKLRQVICETCQTVFMNPCYSDFGFSVLFRESGMSYGASKGRYDEIVEWLLKYDLLKKGHLVLDAGCFEGSFLSKLPSYVNKIGIDINEQAIKTAQEKYNSEGTEFILSSFENFKCPSPPDTITMFHLLEHLPDPGSALRNLRNWSTLNTNLVVEIPIVEKGETNDIVGFLSPQHLTHFSKSSFLNLLLRSGWEPFIQEEQQDYNGLRVICKPRSECTLTSASSKDRHYIYSYLSTWYASLSKVEKIIRDYDEFDKIIIWGSGLHTETLYHMTTLFSGNPNRKYIIIDSDPIKAGCTWRGIDIHSPHIIRENNLHEYQLLISSYGSQDDIYRDAISTGMSTHNIVRLYGSIKRY